MTITLPEPYDLPQTGLAQTLFGGIGQGILSHTENKEKLEQALELEKQKQKMKMEGVQNLLGSLGLGGEAPPQQGDSFGSQGTPPPSNQQQMSQLEQLATNPKAMATLSAIQPQMATQIQQMYGNLLKERKQSEQINLQKQKIALEESKPYRAKIEESRASLPDKEIALERISDALKGNKLKTMRNYVADYFEAKGLPGEYIRSGNAAALQSATKEFLLGDIGRIKGGRPNQFIEKQLSSSYPKAGTNKIANRKIERAMKTGVEIQKKENEIYSRLEEEAMAKGTFLPGNISTLVNKELRPFVIQKEKELIKYYERLNKGTKLSERKALDFYNQAKGNKEEARKLAEEEGYLY